MIINGTKWKENGKSYIADNINNQVIPNQMDKNSVAPSRSKTDIADESLVNPMITDRTELKEELDARIDPTKQNGQMSDIISGLKLEPSPEDGPSVRNKSKPSVSVKKSNKTVKDVVKRKTKNYQLRSHPSNSVCLHDPCGTGVACSPKGEKDFICICSDSTQIKPGDLCPYVKPVNVTPPAISMSKSKYEHNNIVLQGLLLGAFVILMLSILSVVAYWKRSEVKRLLKNKRKHKLEYNESMIKVNAFYSSNIANNPNYCSGASADMLQVGSIKVALIPKENILFHGEIGQGQFGIVYKGELVEPIVASPMEKSMDILEERVFPGEKEPVAVKILKDKNGSKGEIDFQREVEVAAMFKHENILALIGIVGDDDGRAPWMIFEFMPYGDLAGFLRSFNKTFYVHDSAIDPMSKDDLMKISIDIASGMEYLASQHFVHRDLACRNCLVGSNLTVKISDFGMSRDVYTCDYYKTGRNGTALPIRWMSPESITYGKFTLESDVWSFGITLWEVYSFAKLPYYGSSNDEVIKRITGGVIPSIPETCPPAIGHVMDLCWKTSKQRPTFVHIVPYLIAARQNPFALQFLSPPKNAGDLTIYTQLALHDNQLDSDSYLIPKFNPEEDYITVLSSV